MGRPSLPSERHLPSPLHTLPASLVMSVGCWKSVPRPGSRETQRPCWDTGTGGSSQLSLVVKNPLPNAGNINYAGSIPGSGRSPGEGNGYLFQYSCLENLGHSIQSMGSQRIGHDCASFTATFRRCFSSAGPRRLAQSPCPVPASCGRSGFLLYEVMSLPPHLPSLTAPSQ